MYLNKITPQFTGKNVTFYHTGSKLCKNSSELYIDAEPSVQSPLTCLYLL